MDKILLIDTLNFIWRANISFAPKKKEATTTLEPADSEWTMRGDPSPQQQPEPTDEDYVVVFNFFRNLRPIIELFSPDKCFAVLEGHPQFRYDLFADYKANRIIKRASKSKENLDKFSFGKDEILRLMQHLPITTVRASQYEADDTIASLCHDMRDEHLTILSNDSDYIQLLQRGYANCRIYNPIKKTFMVAPTYLYVQHKSLVGDKSDNIPRLVSDKKALDYCTDPASFASYMNIEENRALFSINRKLIEFASIPLEEIEFNEGTRDFTALRQEFRRMKFESIINDNSWVKYTKTFNCLKY